MTTVTWSQTDTRLAIEQFGRIMDTLLATIEEETALVRAGKLNAAEKLATVKAELARDYNAGSQWIKRNRELLARHLPETIDTLRRRHDEFQALLQINLTVLATAHAISEGIIRGVSAELTRKLAPQTYGAGGRTNIPGPRVSQPLTLARSL
jgi:hypothetical protein